MELSRKSGVDLWTQIRTILEREIAGGVYQPGERLPTENELAARFSVNRHTVRRALGALEQDGVVRTEKGRGSFVQEQVIPYAVGKRTRFSENMGRLSIPAAMTFVSGLGLRADEELAAKLGISVGQPVELVETVSELEGRRLSFTRHHFPGERFAGIIGACRETGSITKALARFGVKDYFRKRTIVTARMPTADEARFLGQPRTKPLLVTENTNVDEAGRIIEYGVGRIASDLMQIVFEP